MRHRILNFPFEPDRQDKVMTDKNLNLWLNLNLEFRKNQTSFKGNSFYPGKCHTNSDILISITWKRSTD